MKTIREAFQSQVTECKEAGITEPDLYYLLLKPAGFEILKTIESDIDQLEAEYRLMDPPITEGTAGLPRLGKKG